MFSKTLKQYFGKSIMGSNPIVRATAVALGVAGLAFAAPQLNPQGIIVNPVETELTIKTWVDRDPSKTGNPAYQIGEKISISVLTNQDAYVYLFSVHSNGEIDTILPSSLDANNLVRANTVRTFPPQGANYNFNISGPEGQDRVLAVASKTALSANAVATIAGARGSESLGKALSIVVSPIPQTSWTSNVAIFTVGTPRPVNGVLAINTNPQGAQVVLGNQVVGYTPMSLSLAPGAVTLSLRKAGFQAMDVKTTVLAGKTTSVNPALVPVVTTGTLRFISNPAGADVFVNGAAIGKTPVDAILKEGNYKVEFRLGNYNTYPATATVKVGSITEVRANLQPVVRTGSVQVNSNPQGASVFINNQAVGQTPIRLELNAGTYDLRVSEGNYSDYSARIVVQAGQNQNISAGLQPVVRTGSLLVNSNPQGADVFVNGRKVGNTPLRLELNEATYRITVSQNGYNSFDADVPVRAGQSNTVNANLDAIVRTGSVLVNSNVNGSDVFVNNQRVGQTPLRLELNTGTYNLKVSRAGYDDYATSFQVGAGQTSTITANMRSEARTGSVQVNSNPKGANVYVNNQLIGKAPIRLELNVGSYQVRVEGNGTSQSRTVVISAGKNSTQNFTLRQSTGILEVRTNVAARIFVNGKEVGQTKNGILRVNIDTAGAKRFTITAMAAGYKNSTQVRLFMPGRTNKVTMRLVRAIR